ncbi:SEC-C domain-containing protein [Sinosporangium siamense]|uniref:SEC-C domain-containing protein n=1 Tax=Sinosporangium siamense TaxID=1367973 RepID=UPI00194EE251|nr:SEC-C domain-containing protein [Sinosporangium siamense]
MNVEQPVPPPWWRHLLDAFAEPGALMVEDLAKELGLDTERVESELAASPLFHDTEDGWVHLPHLAEGAVFTHQVTAEEAASGTLDAAGDLALWTRFAAGAGWPLAGGGMMTADASGQLSGPPGWLPACAENDVLAVRLTGGVFEVTPLRPGGSVAKPAAMARVVEEAVGQAMLAVAVYAHFREEDPAVSRSAPLDVVAAEILHNYPGTFDHPHPPLTELLPEGGLVVSGGQVHMRGAPEHPGEVRGMIEDDVIRLVKIRHALSILDADSDLTGTLRHLAVSDAVIGHLADDMAREPLSDDMLTAMAAAAAGPRQQAAVALLASRRASSAAEAAALVEEALALVPDLVPALLDAGFHAACQGDYAKADDLLRRGGVQSDEGLREALRPLSAAPSGAVARNQPCPCGSGLKYKACHQAAEIHPLTERAPLLHRLVLAYAYGPANRDAVAAVVAGGPDDTAGFLAETAAFEYAMAADFLAEHREWLRADEIALLESWVSEPLRVWEVAEADRARGTVGLRDLAGGSAESSVRRRALAQAATVGDVVLARLLDDGTGPRLFVDPPVMRRLPGLPPLADPVDPMEVADFVAKAARPEPFEPGTFLLP